MNCISLNNGKHFYCGDHNLIVNKELIEPLYELGKWKKKETEQVNINETILSNKVKSINHLSFEVTQDCPLNCTYCVYGGSYDFHRTPSKKKMTLSTGIKGLDYLMGVIGDREKNRLMALSFYGGEPLANFQLIREMVLYSKKYTKDWEIKFFMTTNLTILTDEMIEFLVDNRFGMTVSLDGPKEIHDEQRVFHNGMGSHDIVMKNLERIKKENETFFLEKISFNCVFSRDKSLIDVYEFFAKNELVGKNNVRLSSVDPRDSHYYEDIIVDGKRLREEHARVLEHICQKTAASEELLPIDHCMLSRFHLVEELLSLRHLTNLAGSCLFDGKLYLDVNGNFHVCEKINNRFSYGNVNEGFQFDKMEKMVKDFTAIIDEKCSDCVFNRLCARCFICFAKEGVFEFDEQFCKERKKTMKANLENYVMLKSRGVF